jgi:transcriptional regulator NrdR family protein
MATSISFNRNGVLTSFDRDTLFISIYDTLRHRTSALSDAQGLTRTVIANALKAAVDGAVQRNLLVQETIQTLQRFDTAAATMYQAFHKPA